jgi:predicted DNA-binding protein
MARPKSDIDRVQTGLRLRPELVKALRHLAIDQGRPYSAIVEEAIEAYFEKCGIDILPPDKPGEK